jgi:acetylornithine deacetylase/succinyl-diaminopimelate desuccinylase-like protein
LAEFKTHFTEQGMETDVLNIGAINGGNSFNQLPSLMTAKVEIRLLDEKSVDNYRALVEALCQKYNLEHRDSSVIPPIRTDFSDPYIVDFMDSIESITGKRPEGYISGGQSDAPYFVNAGIQCILTCPAGGKHHSEEEWISRESFLQFVPILHNYLEKTAKHPEQAMIESAQLANPALSVTV